jgi:dTMP kinase
LHPAIDNAFGIKAKQFLYSEGKSAHFAAALFYMIDVIRSILLYSWRQYDVIIFVRYLMGAAYLPEPFDMITYRFFASVVPTSPFMLFLDVTPNEADRRLREKHEKLEMFENLDDLKKTRGKAISLAQLGKWRIINANEEVANVRDSIRNALQAI